MLSQFFISTKYSWRLCCKIWVIVWRHFWKHSEYKCVGDSCFVSGPSRVVGGKIIFLMRSPCNFALLLQKHKPKTGKTKRKTKKTKSFFSSHNCIFPSQRWLPQRTSFFWKSTSKQEASVAIISRPAQASRLFYCQLLRHCEHNNIHFFPIPLRFCHKNASIGCLWGT